jgi:hypothetical protein
MLIPLFLKKRWTSGLADSLKSTLFYDGVEA